jgi:ribonuclease E
MGEGGRDGQRGARRRDEPKREAASTNGARQGGRRGGPGGGSGGGAVNGAAADSRAAQENGATASFSELAAPDLDVAEDRQQRQGRRARGPAQDRPATSQGAEPVQARFAAPGAELGTAPDGGTESRAGAEPARDLAPANGPHPGSALAGNEEEKRGRRRRRRRGRSGGAARGETGAPTDAISSDHDGDDFADTFADAGSLPAHDADAPAVEHADQPGNGHLGHLGHQGYPRYDEHKEEALSAATQVAPNLGAATDTVAHNVNVHDTDVRDALAHDSSAQFSAAPQATEQLQKADPGTVDHHAQEPEPISTWRGITTMPPEPLVAAPLNLEELTPALDAAGIELAQTDPAKLAAVQAKIASETTTQPRGRERPPRPAVEDVPLVQVQTRN